LELEKKMLVQVKEGLDVDKKKKNKPRKKTKSKKSPVKSDNNQAAEETEETEEEAIQEKRCDCADGDKATCEHQWFLSVDCPCGDWSVQDRDSLQCPKCYHWYHHDCVGLGGLSGDDVEKLENWMCYTCWYAVSPIAPVLQPDIAIIGELEKKDDGQTTLDDLRDELVMIKGQLNLMNMESPVAASSPVNQGSQKQVSSKDCNTLKTMFKQELQMQIPIIRATVKEVVEMGVNKIVEQDAAQKKSWADMAEEFKSNSTKVQAVNKDMFESVLRVENKKQAEKTEANLNYEASQRQSRRKNVVIRGVPESSSEIINDRVIYDRKWIKEHTDIDEGDIVRIHRPGMRNNRKARPLIILLKSEELVQQYTDHGRGNKIGDGAPKESLYVNIDMSPADQEADFQRRKSRSNNKE